MANNEKLMPIGDSSAKTPTLTNASFADEKKNKYPPPQIKIGKHP